MGKCPCITAVKCENSIIFGEWTQSISKGGGVNGGANGLIATPPKFAPPGIPMGGAKTGVKSPFSWR